ncbi:DUF2812 domain-containing protein [Terrisporobacter sp.]|uniref:DUF2812 domain-containing protein n=1 Tax=Terrisporobacter sp. TaxID=1965305 RepID=UPI00262F1C60|nr:DUF2812 domain-containing protein [Terrisporobacter sp.]
MRIGKNTLIKSISFRENECQALGEYLEEKALQGWLLDEIIFGFFIFKKAEPRKYKFAVDIFTDVKVDRFTDSRTIEYREFCEASGWNYVCETNKYLIFATEDENIVPIQTDEEIILKKVSKSMILNIFSYMILASSVIYNIYNGFFNRDLVNIEEVYGNYYIFLLTSFCITLIGPIIDIVRSSLWYFKYKKALKLGEDIKYPTLKEFKIRMAYYDIIMYMLVILIISLILDLSDSQAIIYIGLITFAIIIPICKIIKIIRN